MSNSECGTRNAEQPKYFRLLKEGDRFEANDVYVTESGRTGTLPPGLTGSAFIAEAFVPHFRPVQVDEWIDYAKQKPTEADFEPTGEVQYYLDCKKQGTAVHGSYTLRVGENAYGRVTHWRRITPPQPVLKRVKVREQSGTEHEVIPQPDGSLKVGCATIPAADFDEIIRQRDAVKKEAAK